jgi:transmembrane sensor
MRSISNDSHNEQIYKEAASWLIELRAGEPGRGAQEQFYRWLIKSPEHMRAYLELAALWGEARGIDFDLARNGDPSRRADNVVSLNLPDSTQRSIGLRKRRHPFVLAACVAALVAVAAAGGLYSHFIRGVYSTDIGELRQITLADGSTVELNAQSRIRVRFHRLERDVELLQGQAIFDVAHDTARPFVVLTQVSRIMAVGTRFDVNQDPSQTTVTVVDGAVVISSTARKAFGPEAKLVAGEQARIDARASTEKSVADVMANTAWTRGQLVFKGATLQRVVAEFNRYNVRRLVIRDAALEGFRVSGIFSSTSHNSFVHFLERRPEIQLTRTADEISIDLAPGSALQAHPR